MRFWVLYFREGISLAESEWDVSVELRDDYYLVVIVLNKPITLQDAVAIWKKASEQLSELGMEHGFRKPLIISGRAPTWLYSYLTHKWAHVFPVIANFDPKQDGAVIVASHHPDYIEMDLLKVRL